MWLDNISLILPAAAKLAGLRATSSRVGAQFLSRGLLVFPPDVRPATEPSVAIHNYEVHPTSLEMTGVSFGATKPPVCGRQACPSEKCDSPKRDAARGRVAAS